MSNIVSMEMMIKDVKSPDMPQPVYLHVLRLLAIIVLYLPMVWYVLHLRQFYSQDTSLLAMEPLHLVGVISLLIAPLFILHLLGIKWRGSSNEGKKGMGGAL